MIIVYNCEDCAFQMTFDTEKESEGSFEKSNMYPDYYICPDCKEHNLKRLVRTKTIINPNKKVNSKLNTYVRQFTIVFEAESENFLDDDNLLDILRGKLTKIPNDNVKRVTTIEIKKINKEE